MSKQLPPSHPTVQVFVDESGTARQSRYLAFGALSFRRGLGLVSNRLQHLRERADWRAEAHFVNVNRSTPHLYREAVALLAASDARFTCMVIDTAAKDPLAAKRAVRKSRAQLVIALIGEVVGADRVAAVVVDQITPPEDVNYEGYVASAVNRSMPRPSQAARRACAPPVSRMRSTSRRSSAPVRHGSGRSKDGRPGLDGSVSWAHGRPSGSRQGVSPRAGNYSLRCEV